MRAKIYLNIAVIGATILTLALWGPAAAGPPEKSGNPGLPGCIAKVSELEDIVANQQETIDQQAARIEELEDMLQKFAPAPKTGQKTSYRQGDDGALQLGVQWPEPRFTDNGDGTVIDNLTRLIWMKDASCSDLPYIDADGRAINWWSAVDACNTLTSGMCGLSDGSSYGDWRLPNVRELHSLVAYPFDPALPNTDGTDKWTEGDPFTGVSYKIGTSSLYYWSSTSNAISSVAYAWRVSFADGDVHNGGKSSPHCYTWCVRGGN